MFPPSRASYDDLDSVSLIELTDANKNKKRWHMANAAIYCSRAFASNFFYENENTPSVFFDIDQASLNQLAKQNDLCQLTKFGGIQGLASSLKIDLDNGILGDDEDISLRQKTFGANMFKKPPSRGFLYFVWEAVKQLTVMILSVTATLSLCFEINKYGSKEGWYNGGSIIIAAFLNIIVSGISNFRQNWEFLKLSEVHNNIMVDVVRSGRRIQISIFKIVVGDVVVLKNGDQVPADGLLVSGYSLQVKESSTMGESEYIQIDLENPFLLSGTKVADGFGNMLVTSVGMNTTWGERMSMISRDTDEQTPLETRLNKLTSSLGKVGTVTGFLVLIVLLIRYFTGNSEDEFRNKGSETKTSDIIFSVVEIIIPIGSIVVLTLSDRRPLAVSLTLAYLIKNMMVDKVMVRKLSACETMGSATVICTDKTCTLTLDKMEVREFWLGKELIKQHTISPGFLKLLHDGVGINTTGMVYKGSSGCEFEFSGSPTEKAILSWAVLEMNMEIEEVKKMCHVVYAEAFNSKNKRSGVAVRKRDDNMNIDVHWKGAAEMILTMCSHYFDVFGNKRVLDDADRKKFQRIIQGMAAGSLRCIAFAHKKVSKSGNKNPANKKKIEDTDLILLGVVGIQDSCRPGVNRAIKDCQNAGVSIKMITGDNVFTAKAIATACNILPSGDYTCTDSVIEGEQFRKLTDEERLEKVDKICVMARSLPSDKLLMVQTLRKRGHIVAVTGDMTNDALALKEADIGLSMGIQQTEVENEISDIVILDNNFESIAMVLKWGRWVFTNIQKFIQFQLTVYVTSLSIYFIVTVLSGDFPMTTVQLLWVDLITDTFAALALVTEKPSDELMKRPPVGVTELLITNIMWRNILFQALYQIVVLLNLQFCGVKREAKNTLIFNTFVLCQVINEFNARKLEKKNVFKGILQNKLLIWMAVVTIIVQAVMVQLLNTYANTVDLDWGQWLVCIGFALMSWLIGWVVKFVPMPQKPFLNSFRSK